MSSVCAVGGYSIKDYLHDNLDADDYRIGGAADAGQIATAERALGLHFPDEYQCFLAEVGWIEVGNAYWFGVPVDLQAAEGSVLRMTHHAREHWSLPQELFVIFSSDDRVLWCLDGSKHAAKSSVVAFDTHQRKLTGSVAGSFGEALEAFLRQ